ncbi:Homoserine kinase [Rhodanobacter lindaniclasticus]
MALRAGASACGAGKTRKARAALAGHYALGEFVAQSSNLALVLAGCWRGDAALVREGLKDVLVEPRRAPLIPNFARVKQAALDHHALGASISGAGPSVFGWYDNRTDAEAASVAMQAAFAEAGLDSDAWVSPIDGPAATLIDEAQPMSPVTPAQEPARGRCCWSRDSGFGIRDSELTRAAPAGGLVRRRTR